MEVKSLAPNFLPLTTIRLPPPPHSKQLHYCKPNNTVMSLDLGSVSSVYGHVNCVLVMQLAFSFPACIQLSKRALYFGSLRSALQPFSPSSPPFRCLLSPCQCTVSLAKDGPRVALLPGLPERCDCLTGMHDRISKITEGMAPSFIGYKI